MMLDTETAEWKLGAKNARAGLSITQSYKHIDRRDYDLRAAHKAGWIAMQNYLLLKEIDKKFLEESVDKYPESV